MRQLILIFGFILTVTIGAEMKQNVQQEIEGLRIKYESVLMGIKGVVGIGIGLCENGRSCLKIYTSLPTDEVLPLIPKELKKCDIELEFVGEIKTQ
ncbi:MAG: hypothetical protein J7L96_07505 [Bacteroidales bacterium]|nr:hypothetical protein [Bacteroidales bacterium]